jgi:outer membrane lipoprotein carrier protein
MKAGVPGRSWLGSLPHTWLSVLLPLIVSLILSSATLSSFAQATGAQAAGSSQPNLSTHELAQRVDSYYNALHSLRTTFTESYEGMGISRKETGTMLLRKPGKMRWDYAEPQGKLFLLEGKYAWFYSPGDAQVQRLAASQLDDLRSPLRFMLGHTQLERELGNLALASTPAGFELSGIPKGMEKRVQNVVLGVAPNGVIQSIAITETDGARTAFTFADQQPNAPVSASDFVFDPPAGIPIVDGLPPV